MGSQVKPKIIWLQSLSCNGNVHSFLNHPELIPLLSNFELLSHPIISSPYKIMDLWKKDLDCDILIIDGSFSKHDVLRGGVESSKLILKYASRAKHIITLGTCASFGGIFKERDPKNISGFAFNADKPTENYKKYADKVITLSGCPVHPKWLGYVLLMLAKRKKIALDELNRPIELYASTVHAGCPRNEYFDWKVPSKKFGLKEGCLYVEFGCQGPYTMGQCNKIKWNEISSKTTVGTPCFGCTEPTFPQESLFRTKTNMGIPSKAPVGVSKRAYLTMAGVAKSFKIKRLEERLIPDDN